MRRIVLLLPVLIFLGCTSGQEPKKNSDEVTLQVIKAKDWRDEVKKYQGKIVAVDVWATWCEPCKESFPHHVELHKKYEKDGVVCISAAVNKAKAKDEALKFLKKEKATFPNYLLDHDADAEYQEMFDIHGPPLYLVYDRNGVEKRFYPNEQGKQRSPKAAQEEMEKHIQSLIAANK